MYSWEIDKLLSEKSYQISKKDYELISNTVNNPQKNNIRYDIYNNQYRVTTIDGYSWVFRINK